MPFNIVLIEPEIPMNTGNIGRLTLATDSVLHLVEPFGFELDDKRVKRAGLDYWKHIELRTYESSEEFFNTHKTKEMVFFSSHASVEYTSLDYQDDLFLIFGKESIGLPKQMIEHNTERLYKIPLFSEHVRSLNLANAVSVVVYEGIRQLKISTE